MTQENEMPGEVFLIHTKKETGFDVAGWDFLLEENEGDEAIQSYIRRAVTKEEAAMVAEYAKAQGQYLHPSSKLFGKQHRMKCWDIIERMAEAHK